MRRIALPLTAAATALALSGCAAFTPAPTATVTVTATPSAEAAAAPAETTPPAPVPTMERETVAPVQAAPAAPATPTQVPVEDVDGPLDTPYADRVTTQYMEGDDWMIHTNLSAADTAIAATIADTVAGQFRDMGNPGGIDLVAVYSADGVMLATSMPNPHPQHAVPGH